MFFKAEVIGFADRLDVRCEITEKGDKDNTWASGCGSWKDEFVTYEKKYEKRSLGRKEQEFGFTHASLKHALDI